MIRPDLEWLQAQENLSCFLWDSMLVGLMRARAKCRCNCPCHWRKFVGSVDEEGVNLTAMHLARHFQNTHCVVSAVFVVYAAEWLYLVICVRKSVLA